MSSATEIRDLLNQVKQSSEKLKSKIYDLDDQIQALYTQRNGLISGSLSKDDYLSIIRIDVQNKARLFRGDMLKQLKNAAKIAYPSVEKAGSQGLFISYLDGGRNMGPGLSASAFHFYFEDVIVSGVARVLKDEPWPSDAIPLDKIRESLEIVGLEIETLKSERDGLASDLVSLGVTE